jgi:hypothetical protein
VTPFSLVEGNIVRMNVLIPTTRHKSAAEFSTEKFVPYTKTYGDEW